MHTSRSSRTSALTAAIHPLVILRRAEGETGGPSTHRRVWRLLGGPVKPGHDKWEETRSPIKLQQRCVHLVERRLGSNRPFRTATAPPYWMPAFAGMIRWHDESLVANRTDRTLLKTPDSAAAPSGLRSLAPRPAPVVGWVRPKAVTHHSSGRRNTPALLRPTSQMRHHRA